MQRGNPEVTWVVDPVAAGRVGLTVEQVSAQMSAAWLGDVATDLRLFDRRVPVRVRMPDRVRFDPAQMPNTLAAHARRRPGARVACGTRRAVQRAG